MLLQSKTKENLTYDAIVVGSGVSGGWAAKELTEKGLKVLMIERGKHIEHMEDYHTAHMEPWDFKYRGRRPKSEEKKYYYGVRGEEDAHFYVKDTEHPYAQKEDFRWTRGYQTGGKSLTWGRQSYRWNRRDFEANLEDGYGVDWPIRYEDLEPWYAHVERFAGISGQKEGLDVLPDSIFQPPMQMTCVEEDVKKAIESKFKNRHLTIGRVAHITQPTAEQQALGRAQCQYRSRCSRGCPYGAYFSSQAATLPAAKLTNNLSVANDKIVYATIFDKETDKVIGVKAIDQHTQEEIAYFAKIIFINASALSSAWIMMQSKSSKHEHGLGNESDQLGRNIMDHHLGVGANAQVDGYEDQYHFGRRPNGIYIPRFVNWGDDKREYLRGFGYQGGASRGRGNESLSKETFGAAYKAALSVPGKWNFWMAGFGEVLPYPENRFTLSNEKDKWGLPVIEFDAKLRDNELKMRVDMMNEAVAMLQSAGFKEVNGYNRDNTPIGTGIHEMGTARMGKDPKTSVLNKWNQVWGAENVFVTDGACMSSASCVNPSLTYMALTARAANFAVEELKKGNL